MRFTQVSQYSTSTFAVSFGVRGLGFVLTNRNLHTKNSHNLENSLLENFLTKSSFTKKINMKSNKKDFKLFEIPN